MTFTIRYYRLDQPEEIKVESLDAPSIDDAIESFRVRHNGLSVLVDIVY